MLNSINWFFQQGLGSLLRLFGYSVVSIQAARPCAWESSSIIGSFPPYTKLLLIGRPQNFFIHDTYNHRHEATYFYDTVNTDQSQLEIYQFAQENCLREGLQTVCDIGCG